MFMMLEAVNIWPTVLCMTSTHMCEAIIVRLEKDREEKLKEFVSEHDLQRLGIGNSN